MSTLEGGMNMCKTHFSPQKVFVVLDWAFHAKRDGAEPPEDTKDGRSADTKYHPLCHFTESPAIGQDKVVEKMASHQDCKPEGRKLLK